MDNIAEREERYSVDREGLFCFFGTYCPLQTLGTVTDGPCSNSFVAVPVQRLAWGGDHQTLLDYFLEAAAISSLIHCRKCKDLL